MKVSTLISLGTAALIVVSTCAASAMADTAPARQSHQHKDSCKRLDTDRHPVSSPKQLSTHSPRQQGPEVTRHLYDHGGYRPGNW
jgi:hypothetical protein